MQPTFMFFRARTLQTLHTKMSLQHWEIPETQSGKKWSEGLLLSATRLTAYLYLRDLPTWQKFLKRNAYKKPLQSSAAECLDRSHHIREDISTSRAFQTLKS